VQKGNVMSARDVSHGRVRTRIYVVEAPANEQVRLHSKIVPVELSPSHLVAVEAPWFRIAW
jgi:hypothetical protein